MARLRGRLHKPSGAEPTATPRRSTRRGKASQEDTGVPDVFQDLLSDATSSKAAGPDEDRKPLKKRKIVASTRRESPRPVRESKSLRSPIREPVPESLPPSHNNDTNATDGGGGGYTTGRMRQTIIDSDESDDSDLEWEDALEMDNDSADNDEETAEPDVGDISITIGGDKGDVEQPKRQVRRRGITSIDKQRRLEIHKMHILCLLYHVHRRNIWCNDEKVQATLRRLPPPKTLDSLVPNPDFTQYQASKRFVDGIQELKRLWSDRFTLIAFGMHRPRWTDVDADVRPFSDFDELDNPMERQDFRKAASSMQGSQDVGTQLFCALLRGIGIDSRLVCSLQCLPFASAAQPSTPPNASSGKNVIFVDPYKRGDASPSKLKATRTPSRPKKLSRLEHLLGERSARLSGVPSKPKKKYHSVYPVYWVEVFNSAQQKWIPADPLSTFTVNAPEKLEPPLSYPENSLVYAVAFEDDGIAKDVTRRYAKAYNAKTRRFRIDSTDNGAQWWKRALKLFERTTPLDRDQVENAALARKEGAEGMPKNVQDFKDHPIYVLERHLKYNEVIEPKHQVGKVNVGTSMNPKMEPIYRRQNVHLVRSADKWYRMGRDIKDGEQPLKHAKPKKNARRSIGPDMDTDDVQDEVGAALYAIFQTDLYVPPPVVRGKVPRNAYGNLDLYVPSMIPKGGVHIRHKLASKAARLISVDSVDAVTGFSFKGRHGTAVVQGVVVAREYSEAVETVIEAMEYAAEEAENSARRSESLRMWRRFYLGLRIAQRVNNMEIEGERGPVINVQEEIEREDKEIAEKEFAGGFFPDESNDMEPVAPTRRHFESVEQREEFGGGFFAAENEHGNEEVGDYIPKDADIGGGFIPEQVAGFGSSLLAEHQLRPRRNDDEGGGFLVEEDDEDNGGFARQPSPAIMGSSSHTIETRAFIHTDNGGGFVPEEQSQEVSNNAPSLESGLAIDRQDHAMARAAVVPEPDAIEHFTVPAVKAPPQILPLHSSTPSSSPSEAGSLLLEDPEDEDADPEWLVDVT